MFNAQHPKLPGILGKKTIWPNTKREKKTDHKNRSRIVETLRLSDRDFMITIIGKGGILYSLRTEFNFLSDGNCKCIKEEKHNRWTTYLPELSLKAHPSSLWQTGKKSSITKQGWRDRDWSSELPQWLETEGKIPKRTQIQKDKSKIPNVITDSSPIFG